MISEQQVKDYVLFNCILVMGPDGNHQVRFSASEVHPDIYDTLTPLYHLKWSERVYGKVPPDGDLTVAENEAAEEFLVKIWPVLLQREQENPYRPPREYNYRSYKHQLEDENIELRGRLEKALAKIRKLEGRP